MHESVIHVTYDVAKTTSRAKELLAEISKAPLFAADFEVAVKYSKRQLDEWQSMLELPDLPKLDKVAIQSKLSATALDHPSHSTITHCSIATSNNHAYVFVLNNKSITDYVLDFLITTPIKQVWHNASYDFQRLYYHTGKFPIDYEDSQILAKTLINHVDTFKARTGLKELQGHKYGAWGISSDNFTLDQMYQPHVLHYAAIDAAATYDLWQYLQSQCDYIDSLIKYNLTEEPPPF